MSRWRTWRIPLVLFVVGLIVFSLTAYDRMRRQSTDPHFVYLADAWLHGKLAITDPPPAKGDDWAKVETVELDDGTTVRGRRMHTRRTFHIAGGGEIDVSRVKRTVDTTHYVSFPPFPAVLMLPQTAIHGRVANDVFTTVLIAALVLPLMLIVLRRLRDEGLSDRTDAEHYWLVAAFAFGTVFYFSAVQGRVWFTAHVVGVALALAYLWCVIGARHPILAGICLGCATMTRVPMAFMFPLFAFEAWRVCGGREHLREWIELCAKFAAPVVVIAIIAMIHNYVRFHEPLEFGHSYLYVRQQAQIETIGMFSQQYLSRNLAVALALLPEFGAQGRPFATISGHGLAIWFTTPLVLLVLWPRTKNAWHRPVLITLAAVALPSLMYQNSGWIQFGCRFSLDYMPLLFVLLAIGGRPLRAVAKALIVFGIIVNLFGAVTFARKWEYYRVDNATYRTVIKH